MTGIKLYLHQISKSFVYKYSQGGKLKDDEAVDGWTPHDGIYELDIAAEEWKRLGSLKIVRFNHRLSVVSNDTWQYCQTSE